MATTKTKCTLGNAPKKRITRKIVIKKDNKCSFDKVAGILANEKYSLTELLEMAK